MSGKHPYANVNGALVQLLDQLRKSIPATVDADLLKKLAIAPKNESYVINVIRFLDLIDDEGKRTEQAQKVFTLHQDEDFQQSFAEVVKTAYQSLFELYGDEAWSQSDNKLISFFRQADQSSQIVGGRQASTFKTLAAYAGQSNGATPSPKAKSGAKKAAKPSKPPKMPKAQSAAAATGINNGSLDNQRVSLTVRIEVNLPTAGDQDTYDKIFKSIRENLMNG